MAYTEPSLADFRARFPEFDALDDALVQTVLDEAITEAGDNWPDRDRARAQLYLTAHILAAEGGTQRTGTVTVGGEIKAHQVGGERTEYSTSSESASSAFGKSRTPYGDRYDELVRRNFGGSVFAV